MTGNLRARLLVAVVGIPLLLIPALRGGWLLVVLIIVIQAVALWEWRRLGAGVGAHFSLLGSTLLTAALDYFVFSRANRISLTVLVVALSVVFLSEVFRRDHQPMRNLGATVLFLCYAALPLAFWAILADPPSAIRLQPAGPLVLLFLTTWVCDSAAYFGGRSFGRHKLHVAASPNKTVEGFVAGVLLAAVVLPIVNLLRCAAPASMDYVMLPLIVGLGGQTADLLESLMKREVAIKDTSALLPGHGGVLDRFDSLLISVPLLFAYLNLSPA